MTTGRINQVGYAHRRCCSCARPRGRSPSQAVPRTLLVSSPGRQAGRQAARVFFSLGPSTRLLPPKPSRPAEVAEVSLGYSLRSFYAGSSAFRPVPAPGYSSPKPSSLRVAEVSLGTRLLPLRRQLGLSLGPSTRLLHRSRPAAGGRGFARSREAPCYSLARLRHARRWQLGLSLGPGTRLLPRSRPAAGGRGFARSRGTRLLPRSLAPRSWPAARSFARSQHQATPPKPSCRG